MYEKVENTFVGGKTTTFCGTPNYIAPEMLRGVSYGISVDLWALGVLTFEMLVGRSPFNHGGATETVCEEDQETEDLLFQVILEQPVRIPRFLSARAASFLRELLEKDPKYRLGCNPSDDPHLAFNDFASHPFFNNLDFHRLLELGIEPPYLPAVSLQRCDVSCFDQQFTTAPIKLTPDNSIRRKNLEAYSILTAELLCDFPYFKGSSIANNSNYGYMPAASNHTIYSPQGNMIYV